MFANIAQGVDQELLDAAAIVAQGQLPDTTKFRVTDRPLYHVQAYTDGGTNELRFFNAAASDPWTTNLPSGTGINNNQFFWLSGVRIQPILNCNFTTGVATTAGLGEAFARGADLSARVATMEATRIIMELGYFNLTVASQTVVEHLGLTNLPQGNGIWTAPAAESTVATMEILSLPINNGLPVSSNQRKMSLYPILPSQRLDCVMRWRALIDAGVANVLWFKVTLDGAMITRVGN